MVCLAFHTRSNGLNEPGEDFLGTRVLLLTDITVYTHQKNLRNAHIINKSYKTADGVRQFGQKRSFCPKGE